MDKRLKRFKPMECPICDGFYFSGPLKDKYDEEIDKYLNGEVRCSHCGWIYDFNQANNPDSKEGFNDMSVNEYKKWFEDKLKENPNFDYSEANLPDPTPHMCPICGKYEFPDSLSSDICPYCGWEDDGTTEEDPSDYIGANGMTFSDYKRNYDELIKENPDYRWDDRLKNNK